MAHCLRPAAVAYQLDHVPSGRRVAPGGEVSRIGTASARHGRRRSNVGAPPRDTVLPLLRVRWGWTTAYICLTPTPTSSPAPVTWPGNASPRCCPDGTAADASAPAGRSERTSTNGWDVSAGHGRGGTRRLDLDERRVSYGSEGWGSIPSGAPTETALTWANVITLKRRCHLVHLVRFRFHSAGDLWHERQRGRWSWRHPLRGRVAPRQLIVSRCKRDFGVPWARG